MPEPISNNPGAPELQDMEKFHRSVREGVTFEATAASFGEAAAYAFRATSLLSDAEELVNAGRPRAALLEIDRAKFLLGRIMQLGAKP